MREILIEISSARFVREQDFNSRKRNGESKEGLIAQLVSGGLLKTQYLLQCKKTSNSLTRLENDFQLSNDHIGNLICPFCNNRYKDELVQKGFLLSDLGKNLLSKSHWMTIWLTNQLIKRGIPKQAIVWNISDGSEEIDLLVEFKGQLWVFELKDRSFGAGDAHPLNYRRVKFRADRAIILTTDKVSKDAKQVFIDLSEESELNREAFIPLYIEGIENAEDTLNKLISDASLISVNSKGGELSQLSSYNLSPIFETHFGKMQLTENDAVFIDDDDLPF